MLRKLILLIAAVSLLAASPAQAKHQPRAAKIMAGFTGGNWICPELPNGQMTVSFQDCFTALPSPWISLSTNTPHPPAPHAQHPFYKKLCESTSFTFAIPRDGNIYVDEWVNGREVKAWGEGPHVIYFFGSNVTGRYVELSKTRALIQANHLNPGCVRLKVAWWRA